MILILTEESDRTADALCQELTARRAPFFRFAPSSYPTRARCSVRFDCYGRLTGTLANGRETVALEEIAAVWLRRPAAPVPSPLLDERVREYVRREADEFLRALYDALPAEWVPGPLGLVERAQLKLRQLELAGRVGFEIPATSVTNDPDELRAFFAAHPAIISKLAGPTAFGTTLGHSHYRYTEPVEAADVAHAEQLRWSPVTFQARVRKRVELRVTIVGEQLFAAEIGSQQGARTREDWRRYDHASTRHRVRTLPPQVADACRELLVRLQLRYGAIDLVETPDGRYVFLELNPAGEFGWIEERAGLPVTAALCDLLTTLARRKEAPRPARMENA